MSSTQGMGMGSKPQQGHEKKRGPGQTKPSPDPARPGRDCAAPAAGPDAAPTRIGVLSDTHGYLHPAILQIFAGVSHIIHAGDIMDGTTLAALEEVAPVTAVAGNLDTGELAEILPKEVLGEVGGILFAVGHKHKRLLKKLAAGRLARDASTGAEGAEPCLVIYGHDHTPSVAWVEGVLYLDPGTATAPDEEDDAATVAIVEVAAAGLRVTLIPVPRSSSAAVSRA